jgi:hypothetical protein
VPTAGDRCAKWWSATDIGNFIDLDALALAPAPASKKERYDKFVEAFTSSSNDDSGDGVESRAYRTPYHSLVLPSGHQRLSVHICNFP